MDFKEIWFMEVDWIHLAHDKVQCWTLVNTVMNLRVLWKKGNILAILTTTSFSRRAPFH